MADFEVLVMRIDSVEDHPNADRLSLNKIRGFTAVSNKEVDHAQGESDPKFVHRYKAGDLVIYVPEGALVPDRLLKRYGYWDNERQQGILAGSKGNRVKAIKLRGIVSQGLIFPADMQGNPNIKASEGLSEPATFKNICADATFVEDGHEFTVKENTTLVAFEGDNVANYLGITKYEPEVPASMSGQLHYNPDFVVKFDVENAQKYPDVFSAGESIVATEKLHGTFTGIVFSQTPFAGAGETDICGIRIFYAAFSKGCGAKGFTFDMLDNGNVYVRQAYELIDNKQFLRTLARLFFANEGGLEFVAVLGETFGKGIQDLHYSLPKASFRAFSIVAKDVSGNQTFFDFDEFNRFALEASLPIVPVLFVGPYDELTLQGFRDGTSAIDQTTVREGIVIVPKKEGRCDEIGRRCLKMISPEYLTRKGGTEYN